ncbi:hypothetical protein CFC21_031343, partial [Triticum aestivum]
WRCSPEEAASCMRFFLRVRPFVALRAARRRGRTTAPPVQGPARSGGTGISRRAGWRASDPPSARPGGGCNVLGGLAGVPRDGLRRRPHRRRRRHGGHQEGHRRRLQPPLQRHHDRRHPRPRRRRDPPRRRHLPRQRPPHPAGLRRRQLQDPQRLAAGVGGVPDGPVPDRALGGLVGGLLLIELPLRVRDAAGPDAGLRLPGRRRGGGGLAARRRRQLLHHRLRDGGHRGARRPRDVHPQHLPGPAHDRRHRPGGALLRRHGHPARRQRQLRLRRGGLLRGHRDHGHRRRQHHLRRALLQQGHRVRRHRHPPQGAGAHADVAQQLLHGLHQHRGRGPRAAARVRLLLPRRRQRGAQGGQRRRPGVQITGNMFNGRGKGVDIVQLDGEFGTVEQVYVQQNSAMGMNLKATTARGSAEGNGSSWTVDFAPVLLFPDRIGHVQYSLVAGDAFPGHTLRNISGNQVVVATDKAVSATVHVLVDQNSN